MLSITYNNWHSLASTKEFKKQEVGIQPVIAAKPISRILSFIMALELHEGSGTNEARPVPVFSEIMVYVWKLNVIKYGSKALNRNGTVSNRTKETLSFRKIKGWCVIVQALNGIRGNFICGNIGNYFKST